MRYRMGILNGDGIGPEIVSSTVTVLSEAAKHVPQVEFEWVNLSMGCYPSIRRSNTKRN
ncbi:hypothetical protein MM817_03097 [Acidibacillus sp. S0AB]|uniref:Isopropylmalate dehydrogenase-like domain-containing protein n=1 Tax=Sulfoacidibacillus ferrooxidans TaxID=2005001 RepID=A0A9X1VBQ7_9BACL|nr:hypothetical protein [Sulfoacidibacillus ferrooxidans]